MSASADTIFALSSGRPPAAIAVIRVSGPLAGSALEKLAGKIPEPRRAMLATIRDPHDDGAVIDQALALWFPGPKSETGEDSAELQLHGGRAVIAGVLSALGRLPGLRPAEPGEFTRRAFLNGQLDLTEVEGLADLIGAETEAQRRQAIRQMRGVLGKRADEWRSRLIALQARIEASLDFSDEGDVPDGLVAEVVEGARALQAEIGEVLQDGRRGERLREGLTIAIAGPPNAGKSTLFNWLAGRDAAIVSPYPGTTRDVLEVHLDLSGYPVTMLDTAGVRESDDPVEREGIARARARASEADLILWVEDATQVQNAAPSIEAARDTPIWLVLNKADLLEDAAGSAIMVNRSLKSKVNRTFMIAAHTGQGLGELLMALEEHASADLGKNEIVLISRERHRHCLNSASTALRQIVDSDSSDEEIVAEHLRSAAHALAGLVGRVDVEDVLEAIFRDFCIGK